LGFRLIFFHMVKQLVHSTTVLCSTVMHMKWTEATTWETVKGNHPTAWQHSSTYNISDKHDIGNNGLGNHEPPSFRPRLSPPWSSFVWTNEYAPREIEISNLWWTQILCPELATQPG
jgi:hypothetical protein